ncbi:DUF2934 domain-containing protein [Myxococcaceae bacterium JPH2]|nr:DUF2934 domain-containing protein [Myxococcaceae bacterium JPH2]
MARHSAQKPTSPPPPTPQERPQENTATGSREQPSHERIARRAYEIFLARGSAPGSPEQDWFQAERELRLGRH